MSTQEEIVEENPQYRQKINKFVVSAIIVLIVGLLLNVFFDGRPKKTDDNKSQEMITPMPDQSTSDAELAKQIQAAIDRKGREANQQNAFYPNESDAETMDRLRNQKEDKKMVSYYGGGGTSLSIEEQFRESELKRALEARKIKFKIQKERPLENFSKGGKSSLENKYFRDLKGQLEKVRSLQKGVQADSSQLTSSSSLQDFLGISESTINVGQPLSESQPKPGQLLIPTGTVISAVLDQDIMSDYVGGVRMRITHDVYDISDSYIMIPKGCVVTGQSVRITNVNEPIQARMGLTVNWLRLPDGKRISFEKTNALDQAGIPAIKDKVNYHFLAQFLGVAAYALVGSETSYEGTGYGNDRTFEGEVGDGMRKIMAAHAAKYLMLVPTITLRAGTPIKIFLEDDIFSYPWENLNDRFLKASR